MDAQYQAVYATMQKWAKSLSDERLAPIVRMMRATTSLSLFISVGKTQPELQPILMQCRCGDDVQRDAAIDRFVLDRLEEIDCVQDDFDIIDIEKLKSYLRFWSDVIARG